MNLISNIIKYDARTFCSGIVEYSLRDSTARTLVGEAGYWIVKGAIVNYSSIKELRNGNIKMGLFKGLLGTACIVNGIWKLSLVITEANEWQCAIWPQSVEGFSQTVALQPCNAFECKPALKMILQCDSKEQCCTFDPSLSSIAMKKLDLQCIRIQKDSAEGFSNLYEMRTAISR